MARLIGIVACMLVLGGCKIVPLDASGRPITNSGAFDPVAYVDSIWDSSVLPAFREKSVDLATLLQALADDPAAAKAQFGRQVASGSAFDFMVKGRARVVGVASGNMAIALDNYEGPVEVAVRLGPAFTGTEIRDSLDFIRFNDFKNVLEYADVSSQLNARVRTSVVDKVDKDTIVGKRIDFYGAFALKNPNSIVVVPVILDIERD